MGHAARTAVSLDIISRSCKNWRRLLAYTRAAVLHGTLGHHKLGQDLLQKMRDILEEYVLRHMTRCSEKGGYG